MNEQCQIIDPHYPLNDPTAYMQNVLRWYGSGNNDEGVMAWHTLRTTVRGTQSDTERHYMTYLRWYAAGNQDGGACARVALEIAS